jgi:predicted MFS family arabinose efflux permease
VSRLTGFLRTWGQAYALGVTVTASCYSVANNLPNQLYEIVIGGMLVTAFLPVYLSVKQREGTKGASAYTSNLVSIVLVLMGFAMGNRMAAVLFVGLLGAGAFATVAPLQLRVLNQAQGAGQSMASSLNIAAFNLGNALGAWLGGVVIEHGPGLPSLPWVAAVLTLGGLAVAGFSVWRERAAKQGGVQSGHFPGAPSRSRP